MPLAQYRTRGQYEPQFGDYIIWSGWFSCWHGIVKHYDKQNDELHVIFAGVPFILFTMSDQEQAKETKKIKLSDIRGAKNGTFSILQHDPKASIWYI